MGKYLFIYILFLSIHHLAGAQVPFGVVKGKLVDSTSSEALQGASLSVRKANDSVVHFSSVSGNEGEFAIQIFESGEYNILISFQGYNPVNRAFAINPASPLADLQTIPLARAVRTLQEVVVTDRSPVRIKGDTVSFNANAYKTKTNASAEDLLKKIPGVQVQSDGTIKAQGEEVQKIYVDGKEFFSNDPSQAAKSLTADMVDRVELYNERSDQSQFSGMDDDSRVKVINLKLKKSKKQGLTGKAYAGAGTDDRYDAGLHANYFKGATRVGAVARSNNTNAIGSAVMASPAGAGRNNVTGIA
jgi:hypothetical protein